jgi:transcriptional regulator with XRE-family HTH domain
VSDESDKHAVPRETRGRRERSDDGRGGSLIDGLLKRAGRVAGGTFDLALDVATAAAMFGDYRLRDLLAASASPERLEAMADAGRFLRDARETAGLSLKELAERLDLRDQAVLKGVEEGRTILPLETVLRAASLLARHDPVPFLIKFLRSYNPGLEATLEQWGVMALPRNYERERRFINLYRQHDFLRELSDDEYQRFVEYMDASTRLVIEVMQGERDAQRGSRAAQGKRPRRPKPASARKGSPDKAAPAGRRGSAASDDGPSRARPVVRKVKPRTGAAGAAGRSRGASGNDGS